MSNPLHVRCPRCNKPVSWGPNSPYKPFCSKQCKLIDLGKWASDEHAIPGEPVVIDPLENDTFDS